MNKHIGYVVRDNGKIFSSLTMRGLIESILSYKLTMGVFSAYGIKSDGLMLNETATHSKIGLVTRETPVSYTPHYTSFEGMGL